MSAFSASHAEIEALAIKAFGEPNRALSSRHELRFGRHGSKAVKPKEGVWHDHETGTGGGYRDLYKLATGSYPENGTGRAAFDVPAAMLRQLGSPVAWWDYRDEAGATVGRVVRFQPPGQDKTYRQCRPDGAGWKWGMGGRHLPLYRLPELRRAPAGSVVFLPEGEGCVDRLGQWRLIATTNAGGAGKFRPDHARTLAGHIVIVLPDNDDAGRKHRDGVMRELRAAGVTAHVLDLPGLPEKGDVLDWIEAGGSLDELNQMTELLLRDGPRPEAETPEPENKPAGFALDVLTPSQIGTETARPYVVKGLIARADHLITMGSPGSGKSALAPHVAYAVAQGRDVFGRRVKAGPVLYLASEDGHGMKDRVRALLKRYGDAPGFHLVPVSVDLMAEGSQRRAVYDLVRHIQPVLIVIDTLAKSFPGLRENESDSMSALVQVVREMTQICGSAVWSIHHVAKDAGTTPRGHGALAGDADLTMLIEGTRNETRSVRLGKNRNGPSDLTFAFAIEAEDLGTDEDGDPITAAVAVEVDAETVKPNREAKLAHKPALLLRTLKNMDPTWFETVKPAPDMPPVQAVRRKTLRDALISQGWFPEDAVCECPSDLKPVKPGLEGEVCGGLKIFKLVKPGFAIENNALSSLKRLNFLHYNRDLIWLLT